MKGCLLKAGLQNIPVVFLFADILGKQVRRMERGREGVREGVMDRP